MLLKLSLIAITLLITFMCLFWAYKEGYIRLNHPDERADKLKGIDVSHYQKEIDWERVAKSGIHFAFIKATEGESFVDRRFKQNVADASTHGILTSAYHYFSLCKSGKSQANHFIHTVDASSIHLAPAVDLEFAGNCNARPNTEELTTQILEFIDIVTSHFKRQPIIYTNYDFLGIYLSDPKYRDFSLWIRNIFYRPDAIAGWDWDFWQYADNGRVDGIQGPVDLNVFKGNATELGN